MYVVKYARRGSDDYNQTLTIRDEVFYKPLGRKIDETDLSCEENSIVIGAFETNSIYNNLIIGCAVMSQHGDKTFKVDWVCADTILRKKGIGTSLMRCVEKLAADRGARKLCLDAPVDTVDFFQRFGYMLKGDIFEKDVFGRCVQMVKPVFTLPKKEKTEGCSCGHDHGHHHHHHDGECDCEH